MTVLDVSLAGKDKAQKIIELFFMHVSFSF
jgi:hypothetical protein